MKSLKTWVALTLVLLISFMLPVTAQASTANSVDRLNELKSLTEDHSSRTFYFDSLSRNARVTEGPIDIAGYWDWNFTSLSAEEPLHLQEDADVITLYAKCEGDQSDDVVFHITDRNGGYYNFDLPFKADGSYTTYPYSFPAGRYWVKCSGSNIVKTEFVAIFSKFKP